MPVFENNVLQGSMQAPQGGRYTDLAPYPTTEQGWADRYDRLWCAYLGMPYDTSEVKFYHLFRALDENNAEIDVTKRVCNVFKFIVDTDVGGLLGGEITLEVDDAGGIEDPDARAALLEEGEAVWKRSKVGERIEQWSRSTATMGDFYVEAVRTSPTPPYKTTLVGYDPRNVTPIYDLETGTKLTKVIVVTSYLDEPTVEDNGTVNEGALHVYRREIDAQNIVVYLDGKLQPDLSGPHGLGVVPVVHMQWTPFTEPEHGLPCAVGIDQAVMAVDSMVTQAKAIFNRNANPIGVIKGAKLDSEGVSNITKFGRWVTGVPTDGDVSFLEAAGSMIAHITAQIELLLSHIEKTEPEFLFSDTGNVSGEARSYKAAAFENKVGNARMRIFGALARVTDYAVMMDRDQPADPDSKAFCVEAPPILPRNLKSEVELLKSVEKYVNPADMVRHLQRLGLVPRDRDPEEYATDLGLRTTASIAP